MNHPILSATVRPQTTKGELRSLRLQGKIPAVMYGGGLAASHILIDAIEFKKATTGITESTILSLDIDGEKKEAFVKARQRAPLTNALIHVDFVEVLKDRALHARVPLHLIGSPIGVKEGGVLENPAHEVEVECLPGVLPEMIEIDVSNLHANHSIHVRDIPVIVGVKILTSPELVVAVVKFAKEEIVETPVAAAAPAGVAGATPVAGAPAGGTAAPAAGAAAPKKEEKK